MSLPVRFAVVLSLATALTACGIVEMGDPNAPAAEDEQAAEAKAEAPETPETKPEAEPSTIRSRPVRTQEVAAGDLVHQVEVIGTLQGIEEVAVYPQVADRVRTLAVREGQAVKAGQLLAVLRSDLHTTAVQQAEAGLAAARANAQALADQVARTRTLVQAGTVSRSQLETLESQLNAAEAQVRQMSAGVAGAAAQKSRTVVTSPIDGVVAQVTVEEGDMAAPQMPLLTVVRQDRLKAVLRAPERDFLRIRQGMPAKVSPLAIPEVVEEAQVTLRGPVVDRMTRTGLVEVELDNPEGHLVPGSAARVAIELDRRSGVLLVPAQAVLYTPETETSGKAIAFVVKDGLAHRRDVIVGERQGSSLEVRDGLTPGDRLVVLGAQLLRDRNPVEEQDAKASAASES